MKFYRKGFSLLELLIVIVLIGLLTIISIPKSNDNKFFVGVQQIANHIKLTRLMAMSDNIFHHKKINNWHKSRWTIKFMNCKQSVGGLYYVVYKDSNFGGMPNKNESAIDPITKKYLYSNNDCKATNRELEKILLTKYYGIASINITCNETTSIGQFSFGYLGEPYTKLSGKSHDFLLKNDCDIILKDIESNKRVIRVNKNGFVKVL